MTGQIKTSKYLLALGFAVVLLLMAALAIIGISHAVAIKQRMDAIVNEYGAKTDLVATMRNVARERSISLHRMSLMTDPFDRDEEYLKFRQAAWDFMAARQVLEGMHLTPIEEETFRASQRLTVEATKYQDEVYSLITDGRLAEANKLLLTKAVPAQDRVFAQFSQFLELQKQATRNAMASAHMEYRHALFSTIGLGVLALLLGAGIAVFVTRRSSETERALFKEKQRAEVTLHSITDGVITTTSGGTIEYMNPVAEQLTGWSNAEARGKQLAEVFRVIDESTGEEIPAPLSECLIEGQVVGSTPHSVLVARDKREYAIEQSAAPMRDDLGWVVGSVLVFRDVTQSRHLARELSWRATHDPLTGLGNRTEFESVLEQTLESAQHQHKHHALIYMDLDQFKVVNDTCGHVAGDELLRQLALLLSAKVREGDSLFRLGGDEFAILLSGCPLGRAQVIANDLREMVEEFRFGWQDRTFAIGASLGLVPITAETVGKAPLLAAADAACYMAKEKGRNRVQVYEPGDTELARREGEMEWLLRLNSAMEEDRLVLYFQKIVRMAAVTTIDYEILLRLRDEQGRLVPPQAFIPAAERYHLMPSIDRWVFRHVMEWLACDVENAEGVQTLFINLSGQSLNDEKFLPFVVEQLRLYPLAAQKVGFEITETAAIANLARAVRFISTLKTLGCRFALDDFGSGMSSFAYLKNLRVDKVKIDGIFVRDMLNDNVDLAMVEAINHIGHVMGIETVAEFVENEEILAKIRELGVDYGQGYGIHRPEALVVAKDTGAATSPVRPPASASG
jgi:diguanylate cyclase (GGDEF)-like protein/PAS domain S-box-containing protein